MFYSLMRRIILVWKQIERGWGLISKNLSVPIFFIHFPISCISFQRKAATPIPHPHPHPRSGAYYTNVKKITRKNPRKMGSSYSSFNHLKLVERLYGFEAMM